MKKISALFLLVLIAYLLSFLDKFSVYIIFLTLLFSFIAYLFYTSKPSKNRLVTFVYVMFSFLFVVCSDYIMITNFYDKSPFFTIIILGILLPTCFLLGYRILLSLHCFWISAFGKSKLVFVDNVDFKAVDGCSIVISTRNEPFDVCKMTFDSAYQLKYPDNLKEIIVVDNSDIEHEDYIAWKSYVESKNGKIVCKFIHRDGTDGFKPRNLDIAMEHLLFKHVMFLDADSTMPTNALEVAMPEFLGNEKLGFVSFLIESTNYSVNLFTKAASIFQNVIRHFNEFVGCYGYGNYQGHNGIWSTKALAATSKWEEYYKSQVMVTEDIAAGFRCYEAGFSSKPVFLKTGEWVPTSLGEFEKMWLRWSFGGMQVMSKYFGRILTSSKISMRVKLDMLYLLFKIVVSGFPILALLLVIFPKDDLGFVLMVNVSVATLFIIGLWYYIYGSLDGGFFSKIYQIYLAIFMLSSYVFWCGINAEISYYLNKKQGWKSTSKKAAKEDSWANVLYSNYGKILYSLCGLTFAVISIFTYYDSLDFSLYFWCMFPSILLFANTILCVLLLGKTKL